MDHPDLHILRLKDDIGEELKALRQSKANTRIVQGNFHQAKAAFAVIVRSIPKDNIEVVLAQEL